MDPVSPRNRESICIQRSKVEIVVECFWVKLCSQLRWGNEEDENEVEERSRVIDGHKGEDEIGEFGQ